MDQNQNPFGIPTEQPETPAQPTDNPFAAYDQPAQPVPPEPPTPPQPTVPVTPVQPTYYTQPAATPVPPYAAPPAPATEAEEPLSVGQWMLTILVMFIPCVNLVMMFVWAFGSGNKGRANYFKATLIWAAILVGLELIIGIACAILGVSLFQNFSPDMLY